MSPCKAFVAFPEFDDAHFLGVAADSAVVFDSSFGSPREILSLIRAKEIAQVCLAEAIVKTKAEQARVLEDNQQELASAAGSSGSSKDQMVDSAVQGSQKSESVALEPQKGEKKKREA
jgi:L-rhamnose isomerase